MQCNLTKTMKISLLMSCLALFGCSNDSEVADKIKASHGEPLNTGDTYTKPRTIENFYDYVEFLKNKAAQNGVSTKTLGEQKNIQYISKAVMLDQQQAGRNNRRNPDEPPKLNPNGATNYLNRVLTQEKVDIAAERLWEIMPPLENASKTYSVPKEYLLALWGMESSFGHYQGKYDVLSVLATLAFDGRRENLFSKEFINAMKMLDHNHIDRYQMLGSWAGAMGQTQFMPTSFLNYAADGDGDGVKNIWTNHYDIFASIANYLHTVGWDKDLPWGIDVALTQPLELNLSGIEANKKRSLSDWQRLGVSLKFATPQEQQKLAALSSADLWLIRPDKEVGRAFLVSNNFRTILDWNRSQYFGLSIGMFADRIKQQTGL